MFQLKILSRALRLRSPPHFSDGSQRIVALGLCAAAAALSQAQAQSSNADTNSKRNNTTICQCQEAAQPSTSSTKDQQQSSSSHTTTSSSFCLQDVYEIDKVLGEGAYGMVYQARRKEDGTLVALKTMPRSLTGKTDFEREVAALQLLSKPTKENGSTHIVQLYDLHRDDDNYYLAMELIEGGELLEHLIANGPYSEALAASFLRQFAEAICFVHSNGLAHADLKPENLLLSSNDMTKAKLKVADFGCARSHDLSRTELHLPAQEFAMGCSFLHMVALGNQFELERLLQERPALVNFRDYDFRTPLHLAASEGHVDICRFLVERGARVNRSDRWGGSPLDDAHRHRHAEVIQYLRQQGATFGALTQLPRFIQAASEGDKEEVEALLEFGNIDLDEGDYDRRAALHLAAGEGRKEIVELLCKEGANVNVEDRWGNRPLDDAKTAKKNSNAIVNLLAIYGAKSIKDPSLGSRHMGSVTVPVYSTNPVRNGKSGKKDKGESFSGTIAYWPPELFADGAAPTPASDMWAVGVIMFVLLTGSHPFDKYNDLTDDEIEASILNVGCKKEQHMELINTVVFDERIEGLSASCIELMRHLMHPDPEQRMSSGKFLRHPWIQGLTASWTTMGKTHDELKTFWQNRFRAEIVKKFAESLGITGDNKKHSILKPEDLATMFRALDIKKNGVLELDEIQTAFRDLGISDKNVRQIFASADLDGTGVIRFDEFRTLLMSKEDTRKDGPGLHVDYLQQRFKSHILKMLAESSKEVIPDKKTLRKIFNSIDQEGNGVLDPQDIRVVLRSAGEPDDVISRIAASLDLNRKGRVSWEDFLLIMGLKKE